ncbi:PREDICTED: uncharacterized protein LOC105577263 isoform X2 [Cercocebus atys]|uniref:uncharacterized protein LOC105577263 isoform X2 n=1 Tax=Cercocebus atys TaxID=9531 RepID=UPI0005F48849|nr:PREDICTED: uncharacterized protein LOC105577263 isoform X2 [Cercocebus atys]
MPGLFESKVTRAGWRLGQTRVALGLKKHTGCPLAKTSIRVLPQDRLLPYYFQPPERMNIPSRTQTHPTEPGPYPSLSLWPPHIPSLTDLRVLRAPLRHPLQGADLALAPLSGEGHACWRQPGWTGKSDGGPKLEASTPGSTDHPKVA